MNEGAFETMRSKGLIICLSAEPETIYQRVKNDDKRPLLKVKDPILQIKNILRERRNTYQKADLVIETDDLQLNDIASRIINAAEVK